MAISREQQDHAFYQKLFTGDKKIKKSAKILKSILNSNTLAESFITNLGGLSAIYSNEDKNNTLCKTLGESEYGEQAFMNYLQFNGITPQSTFSLTLENSDVQTVILKNTSMIRGVMCIPSGLTTIKNSSTFMAGIAASEVALDIILTIPEAIDAMFTSSYSNVRIAYMSEKYILRVYGNNTKTGKLINIAAKQNGYVFTKEAEPLAEAMSYYAVAIIGNYIYFIGGTHPSGSSPSPYVSYKKASLDNPTILTKSEEVFTFNVYGSTAIVIDNTIYVYGTNNFTPATSASHIAVGSVSDTSGNLVFRTVIPSNVTNTDFNYGRSIIIGDDIMFYGGVGSGESTVKTRIMQASVKNPLLVYDTGKFLPFAGGIHQVMLIGNYIYLYSLTTIMRAPISDPTSISILSKKLPYNCSGSTSAIIGDYIYIYGGSSGLTKIMRASLSAPDSFTVIENTLPVNVHNSRAIIIKNKVYIYGSDQSSGRTVILSAPLEDIQ